MTDVPNTADSFDDCVGKRDKQYEPITLFDMEDELPNTEDKAWDQFNWEQNWKGMPSYQSDDLEAVKKIIINFSSEADFNEFCQRLGYKSVKMTTKTTFYPERKPSNLSILRWVDESEANIDDAE
jgi:hypothetical protein